MGNKGKGKRADEQPRDKREERVCTVVASAEQETLEGSMQAVLSFGAEETRVRVELSEPHNAHVESNPLPNLAESPSVKATEEVSATPDSNSGSSSAQRLSTHRVGVRRVRRAPEGVQGARLSGEEAKRGREGLAGDWRLGEGEEAASVGRTLSLLLAITPTVLNIIIIIIFMRV
ncbi:hypothetical protein T492DRAFT_831894 [Pavlovales sp. CCMP2436]|nr:hypothetical protein T492DRAFT_831894 [Pavlovales sp. CCMP2436]